MWSWKSQEGAVIGGSRGCVHGRVKRVWSRRFKRVESLSSVVSSLIL